MGSIFPDATGLKHFWQLLRTSHDAIRPLPPTHWRAADYLATDPLCPKGFDTVAAATGGFIEEVAFDPAEFGIPPTILEATDTAQLLSLVAAREALDNAGYGKSGKTYDKTRVGVITGATGAQELTVTLGARLQHPRWRKAMTEAGIAPEIADEVARRIAAEFPQWQENSFPGLLGNVIAGRIANRLDLRGTNCAVDAACASSLGAIHLAMMELETNRADMLLAGGVDTFNDIFMFMCFSQSHALSPTQQIKPFSDESDGTILGEGIGMIVLKRLEDAKRDNDRIFAVIRGMGTSSDGKSLSIYAPSSPGQQLCLRDAYQQAGISPAQVSLLEAHGTGTKVGDAVEFEAASAVYAEAAPESKPWCAIGTVKAQIGHCKASAGVASIIKTALALHHKVMPATIKVTRPNPAMDFEHSPFYLNTVTRPWFARANAPRFAGVSSFGFGGSNFHAVMEEATSDKSAMGWDASVQIWAFSADTREELKVQLHELKEAVSGDIPALKMEWIAQETRKAFAIGDKCRLILVHDTTENKTPESLIDHSLQMLTDNKNDRWHENNIYYGEGAPTGKLAVLFPGQGSQYLNMARDILCLLPDSFETVNNAKSPNKETTIGELVFPMPTFDKELTTNRERQLAQTQFTQPVLAAINLAYWKALAHFGIAPDCFAGHSFGELCALAAAGMISEDTLQALAAERGKLMSQSTNGAMLAVQASLDAIEQMITEDKLDVVLANRNSPTQGILSGGVDQIEAAESACGKRGMGCKRLNVSGAFHSPLMQEAYKAFGKVVKKSTLQAADKTVVYANVTALPYSGTDTEQKDLLVQQLVNPVRFVELVQNMTQSGVTTFIECGPKAVLTKLAGACLKGTDCLCIATDASAGRKSGIVDLARVLAQIASLGHQIDLTKWEDSIAEPARPKMCIKLNGVNYRDPKKRVAPQGQIPELVAPRTAAPTLTANTPTAPTSQAVRTSFESIKQVQQLAADAHQKYLETQAQIQQTLQVVLQTQAGQLGIQMPAMGTVAMPAQPSRTQQQTTPPPQQPAAAQTAGPKIEAPAPSFVQRTTDHIASATGHIIDTMMEVVAELTGYPKEMLDLDMDMEADLGIDSIKRVEILSAIQKRVPGLPQVSSAVLGTLKTLREVAEQFKVDTTAKTPQPQPQQQAPMTHAQAAVNSAAQASSDIIATMMEVVAELTGYPKEMLDLDMDMEADLGIDSIKRVEILSAIQKRVPGLPQVSSAVLGTLKTLREVAEQFKVDTTAKAAQAQPQQAPATPAQAAVNSAAQASSDIIATMMEVVAELTGYPKEMLELDMDMEADLGIDSIKRVEILSAIQKRIPGLPQVSSAVLGSLKTLREVAEQFKVDTSSPTPATVVEQVPAKLVEGAAQVAVATTQSAAKLAGDLFNVVANLTGYPTTMLDPDMDMEADLGIDSIKRVEILSEFQKRVPGLPQINSAYLSGMHTLREILDYMAGSTQKSQNAQAPTATAAKTPTTPETKPLTRRTPALEQLPAATIGSTDWTPGDIAIYTQDKTYGEEFAAELKAYCNNVLLFSQLGEITNDAISNVTGLIILASPKQTAALPPDTELLKNAFAVTKFFAPTLLKTDKATKSMFAVITWQGGHYGLDDIVPQTNAAQGGLAGIAKTAAIEWPDVDCRVIDCGDGVSAADIINELRQDGAQETGLTANGRVAVALKELPTLEPSTNPVGKDDWVIVTGGARGVTVSCIEQLARRTGCNLMLLGRSAYTADEPAWLKGLTTRNDINQAIMKNAFAGKEASPAAVRQEYSRIMARREIAASLNKLIAQGIRAEYVSVDVRDTQALQKLFQEMRDNGQIISGLVHAAGVIEDKLITEKTPEQFERVVMTKVQGLEALLEATAPDTLKFIAMFSSVSARFGNRGQVDYSLANETMNKIAQHLAKSRPATRVVALNWGPWESGMVTPQLKHYFESRGIAVIKLDEGAKAFVTEVCQPAGSAPVEVVLGHGFESLQKKAPINKQADSATASTPGMSKILTLPVTDSNWLCLKSHQIAEKEVMPLALSLELLAHGAMLNTPGLCFVGADNVRVYKGITVDSGDVFNAEIWGNNAQKQNDLYSVMMETRPEGNATPNTRAEILLAEDRATSRLDCRFPQADTTKIAVSRQQVYDHFLFHGSHFQSIDSVCAISNKSLIATCCTSPDPRQWLNKPLRPCWLTDPLVTDTVLQLGIVWNRTIRKIPCLPSSIAHIRHCAELPCNSKVIIELSVLSSDEHSLFANAVVFDATTQLPVMTLSDIKWTADQTLAKSFGKDAH